ncbi:hypothetical protein EK21DRAFT_61429 [Setomelanomma holmii]|uniref:MARVEL domain-containing protein n=1 Tax=Setomelanomma holmii TaxID=210430 RepID=A0A9P4HEN5_9PLEO|nr:hypothetical protein EK21DRAFT_61429 [Setomelanomma holmii]
MLSSPIINWALRAFQFLFGIVILGLSVTLIRGHHWGDFPSSLGFSVFVAGVTILASIIGFCATWVSFLEGIVGLAIDVLIALINIAGGIVLAIKLKGVKCSDTDDLSNAFKLAENDLFNGGWMKIKGKMYAWVASQYGDNGNKIRDVILGHCRESQAAMVFMFLAAALLIVSGLLAFLRKRKGY